jgi:hypothetical protein
MARWLLIVRHPVKWLVGACFICGRLMLFDDPRLIGNAHGFCWYHGERGSVSDVEASALARPRPLEQEKNDDHTRVDGKS